MKKIVLIFLMGAIFASCAKKMAPTSNPNSSPSNEKIGVGNSSPQNNQEALSGKANGAVEIKPEATIASASVADQAAKPIRGSGELTIEQKGQAIYNVKCNQCHQLKVTTDYTVDRWTTVMQVMAVKANLSDEEKERVLAYVRGNAKK